MLHLSIQILQFPFISLGVESLSVSSNDVSTVIAGRHPVASTFNNSQ